MGQQPETPPSPGFIAGYAQSPRLPEGVKMPEEAERAPEEDQETPQQEPETPSPEGEDTAQGSEDTTDWRQRYEEARPELDRVRQLNSEYERTIAAAREGDPEAIAALGFELSDPEQEGGEEGQEDFLEDPYEQRLAAIEEQLGSQQEQEQMEQLIKAENNYISNQISELAQKAGREFSDDEVQTIGDLSLSLRTEEGFPDVQEAYNRLDGLSTAQRKAYAKKKREAVLAPEGIPGSEKVNLRNDQSRQGAMARIMEAEAEAEPG